MKQDKKNSFYRYDSLLKTVVSIFLAHSTLRAVVNVLFQRQVMKDLFFSLIPSVDMGLGLVQAGSMGDGGKSIHKNINMKNDNIGKLGQKQTLFGLLTRQLFIITRISIIFCY